MALEQTFSDQVAHHRVHVCEPVYVPGHACDLHAKVAYAYAALASCARIQQSDLDERELALCKRLGVLQDDRDGFVRVEHAEGEVGRRWLIEVAVVVRDA